ncbi:hypothetical protein ACN28E_03605 [Archangium lansingense]|uniref:hypothetical protein n=1 Tax=Archangium lansingense TaxID=2995310 RepID=UPI003B8133A0
MQSPQATPLQLPSFLYGPSITIKSKTRAEGRRCGKQYQLNGSLPQPRELRTVSPEEVVFTHGLVDFQNQHPAWRLYMVSDVMMSLYDVDEKNHRHLSNLYEATFRETSWGALYFALSGMAPESAERIALRLQAVLRFWDALQHGRYLHQTLNTFMSLEELMTDACGWAMDAWCPEGGASIHSRFSVASERMARATREDCVEAILRQLPRIFSFADRNKLNHPHEVMDATAWREHLATLDATEFERISAVRPGAVLQRLYIWDRQLDLQ